MRSSALIFHSLARSCFVFPVPLVNQAPDTSEDISVPFQNTADTKSRQQLHIDLLSFSCQYNVESFVNELAELKQCPCSAKFQKCPIFAKASSLTDPNYEQSERRIQGGEDP